jgi:ATP-dependent Clp protease ATP-binding subunit ClpA
MNPFTFGNPIKEPERFYGRSAEIRQIINRLLSSAHESTSIVGERRIGKTSLLYHLSHPDVSARVGLTPDKFCLVYVDFLATGAQKNGSHHLQRSVEASH